MVKISDQLRKNGPPVNHSGNVPTVSLFPEQTFNVDEACKHAPDTIIYGDIPQEELTKSVENLLVHPSQGYEYVDHPNHYNNHPSGVECKEIIGEFNFNIGAAIKHLWRCGLKPGSKAIDDLRKAIKYIEFEIERLEKHGRS